MFNYPLVFYDHHFLSTSRTSGNGSTNIYYNWDVQQPDDNDDDDCAILNENLKLQNEGCYWEFCFPCVFKRQVGGARSFKYRFYLNRCCWDSGGGQVVCAHGL